jgi:hypothetical protein
MMVLTLFVDTAGAGAYYGRMNQLQEWNTREAYYQLTKDVDIYNQLFNQLEKSILLRTDRELLESALLTSLENMKRYHSISLIFVQWDILAEKLIYRIHKDRRK